ncbi:putative PAS/PAC sensor protein [Hymenobacter roseosalivarius DSM 11622]|uniref:Putative PAS/PAC sensor protein n=1 Tax=Hymenobacter roseosalivarius DSM 11622 TaxID=645990 RepID=A0A1W1W253_9BACT|nr:PAS domain-containing protein [Hymenobacter roseosalivarius]SMB99687.1 putative PAS/PAC sensor protein [Hymenobacter roseosalivarius DSM 11622]
MLAALLTTSLTGVIFFRPVYAAGEEDGELVDLAYVHLNPAAQQMLRRPACPPETFLTLYPSAAEAGIFAFYCDTFRSGQPGRFNVNYQHDGLDNYFHLAGQRAGDLLVVSFTDTAGHDRSATEAALRASQAREQAARAEAEAQRAQLQALLQQAPMAIAFFEDPAQRITAANPRMCAIWDRAPEQALGRPLLEALPELRGQGFDDLIAQAVATGSRSAAPKRRPPCGATASCKPPTTTSSFSPSTTSRAGCRESSKWPRKSPSRCGPASCWRSSPAS